MKTKIQRFDMGLFTSVIHRDRGDRRVPGYDVTLLDSSVTSSPNFGASENVLLDHYLRLPETVGLEVIGTQQNLPKRLFTLAAIWLGFFYHLPSRVLFPYPTKLEKEKHRLNDS